jgi:hypothetical protein
VRDSQSQLPSPGSRADLVFRVYQAIDSRSGKSIAIKRMLVTPKREVNFAREIAVQKEVRERFAIFISKTY